jgi:hypothetical protein
MYQAINLNVEEEVKKMSLFRNLLIALMIFGLAAVPAFAEKTASGDYVPAKPYNPSYTDGEYEFTWADGLTGFGGSIP